MNDPNHIRIWTWADAPDELRSLSPHGGDEDWVALIPPRLSESFIPWLEDGGSFGCSGVSCHAHPELPGYEVRIGAHA